MEILLVFVMFALWGAGGWVTWIFIGYDLDRVHKRFEEARQEQLSWSAKAAPPRPAPLPSPVVVSPSPSPSPPLQIIASRRPVSSLPASLPVTKAQPESRQIEVQKTVRTRAGALEPR
jgi:hypothetical protein